MKDLNELFPSLEICQELSELRLFSESVFVWTTIYGGARPVQRNDLPYFERDNFIAPAPTLQELIEWLKYEISITKTLVIKGTEKKYDMSVLDGPRLNELRIHGDNLSNMLAKIIIGKSPDLEKVSKIKQ